MALRAKTRIATLPQQDRKFIGRDAPPHDLQIVGADGSLLRDVRGRTIIDFLTGWCVGNLGWNRPEIRARLHRFSGPDYVDPGALYAPWVELARRLAEYTPGHLERCYRAVGGTEAVEIALQIARAFTGRDKVISIADDYHGNSIAVKGIDHRIKPPLDEAALPRLERALEHRQVAALIMEPIITNLACEIPTAEFMTGAAELCERYGTLLIADEVATGFGRTGTLFACELYDLEPDIMCMAKALTNGAAPIGATITTRAIAGEVEGELEIYSTYGWHPLACEAALEVLDIWRRDGEVLLAQVAERSEQVAERFAAMVLPEDTEVRIKGLAIGIELPEDTDADEIVGSCLERGLLISGEESELSLFPALTIDRATTDAALDILEEALTR
jgi:adenosylmethionine-8-amino-7-oxononanoate aminotransferase